MRNIINFTFENNIDILNNKVFTCQRTKNYSNKEKGHICALGSTHGQPCPAGSFCPKSGQSAAIACPPGTYNSGTGWSFIEVHLFFFESMIKMLRTLSWKHCLE